MIDTNDMRREFVAWFFDERQSPKAITQNSNVYTLMLATQAWCAWQAATERATAVERERCAAICDSVNNYDNPMTANDCAAAIRQATTIGESL